MEKLRKLGLGVSNPRFHSNGSSFSLSHTHIPQASAVVSGVTKLGCCHGNEYGGTGAGNGMGG